MAYGDWTASTNGSGLNQSNEITQEISEWNNAFFDLLAHCLSGLEPTEVDEFVLKLIIALPDRSFFDVVASFLRSVDDAYFNGRDLQEAKAVGVRLAISSRLMRSSGWLRLNHDQSKSIEMHIGPAIAAMFFNSYFGFGQPPKCYLLPNGIDQLDPFISLLVELAEGGSCLFVSLVTLNLLETSPRVEHLPLLVIAGTTWLRTYSDDTNFWIDQDIGRRVCALIEKSWQMKPAELGLDKKIRREIDTLLAGLVRLGVPEANWLEKALVAKE